MELDNRNVADRKRAMLNRWLSFKHDAAWEDVVSVLSNMDENRTAKIIQEKYCAHKASS